MFYWLQKNLPKIVIAPSFAVILWFVYGFILWTVYVSMTNSKMLPRYDFVGLKQHFRLWSQTRWYTAVENLLIFTVLFIGICIIIGIVLSILLDQKIRAEGFFKDSLSLPHGAFFHSYRNRMEVDS